MFAGIDKTIQRCRNRKLIIVVLHQFQGNDKQGGTEKGRGKLGPGGTEFWQDLGEEPAGGTLLRLEWL